MENRFENDRPEERLDWGRYATPPPRPGEKHNLPENEVAARQTATSLCDRVRDTLPALLENDGGIRPEMATAIRAHLSGCTDCTREYRQLQRLATLIEQMPLAEMPKDYSALIMRKIEQQAHPVWAAQALSASAPKMIIETAVTTVNKTQATQTISATQVIATRLNTLQRLFLAAIMTALLGFFLASAWGRQMLGVNCAAVGAWLGQAADAIRSIPILGAVASWAFMALSQAGDTIQATYRSLGASATGGVAFDAAIGGAACAFVLGRQRAQSRGYDGGRRG